jgi:RluA family pseudouridine synthase
MQQKGFTEVYQLDGGILKYFEECGSTHYRGDCFVFDGRVALDPNLQVTGHAQCFACQAILSAEDQRSPLYEITKSCPKCFRTRQQRMRESIDRRHVEIAKLVSDLPGSRPHQQQRPIRIPARMDGWQLMSCLSDLLPQVSHEDWQQAFTEDRILDDGVPARADRVVRGGEQFLHVVESFLEPDVNANIRILYEDASIIVVDKPAPLPAHPSGRFFHNTLTQILSKIYRPEFPRAAHRLDANTTGVMVLARCRAMARIIQRQFEQQETNKTYVALCHGSPTDDEFRCELPIGEQPGPGRVRVGDQAGHAAVTKFKVLRRHDDGNSLIEVTPLTGRTNQIRVHLWELGFPIVGDPLYLPERILGTNEVQELDSEAMCLHAKRIEFKHPKSGEKVSFEAPVPEWI